MWRRPPSPIALAAVSTATAVLVWVAAFLTDTGVRLDTTVFEALTDAGVPLRPRIEEIAQLAAPRSFVLIGLALAVVALVRRRRILAMVVPLVLVAANATAQGLQALLPRLVERPDVGTVHELAWPSGHAAAAMSLALCGVLVASPRLRPAAALLGAGYTVAVGYAQIALGSHVPSDVLGGYLIAATFVLLGVAALSALGAVRPGDVPGRRGRIGTPLAAPAIGALGVLLAACVAVLTTDAGSAAMAQNVPALAAGSGIAALGVMLIAGLGLALRS